MRKLYDIIKILFKSLFKKNEEREIYPDDYIIINEDSPFYKLHKYITKQEDSKFTPNQAPAADYEKVKNSFCYKAFSYEKVV